MSGESVESIELSMVPILNNRPRREMELLITLKQKHFLTLSILTWYKADCKNVLFMFIIQDKCEQNLFKDKLH